MEFAAGAEIARQRAAGHCEVSATGCEGRDTQTHHRRARGMGGRSRAGLVVNLPSNLLRVCGVCHRWIEAHPPAADALGLLHPADATDPAWLRTVYGIGWFRLDDEGCYGWVHDQPDPDPRLLPVLPAA